MPKITTFLTFADRTEEAATLYTSIFPNSKVTSRTRGPNGAFIAATFELDGQSFMALTGGPTFHFSQGISLFVSCKTQEEIDTYTEKLVADGGEQQPCGWLRDKFGVSWQIIPSILGELLGDPDPTRAARVMLAMMNMQKLDIAALRAAREG